MSCTVRAGPTHPWSGVLWQSTVANALDVKLTAEGRHSYILDGDNVRHGLNSGLGFSAEDRRENVRRVAEVARLMVDLGTIVLVPVIRYKVYLRYARGEKSTYYMHGAFLWLFVCSVFPRLSFSRLSVLLCSCFHDLGRKRWKLIYA